MILKMAINFRTSQVEFDTINVKTQLKINGVDITESLNVGNSNLVPKSNQEFDIGSTDLKWKSIYLASNINVNTIALSENSDNQLEITNGISTSNLKLSGEIIGGVNTSNLNLTGEVECHLIPSTPDKDLGTIDKPWRELYVSSNSLHVGGTIISDKGNGYIGLSGGLTFGDTTQLESTSNIQSTILNDGESLGEFTSINEINTTNNNDELTEINGSYHFGNSYNTNRNTGWTAYDFQNYGMLPINASNIVDMTKANTITTGNNPNKVIIPLYYENDDDELLEATNLSYLVPNNYNTLNEYFPLRQLDMQSDILLHKFLADYTYINNEKRLKQNKFQTGLIVNSPYIHFGDSSLHTKGTTSIVVDFIAYYNLPEWTTERSSENKFKHFISSSLQERKENKIYKLSRDENDIYSSILTDSATDNGLYPRISYTNWTNSVNPKLTKKLYTEKIGWGTSSNVLNAFNSNDYDNVKDIIFNKYYDINGLNWIRELLTITYKFVKYGDAMNKRNDTSDTQLIATQSDNVLKSNLRFISEVIQRSKGNLINISAIVFDDTYINSLIS